MGRRTSNFSQLLDVIGQKHLLILADTAGITLSQRRALAPIRQELEEKRRQVEAALPGALRKVGRTELKPVCQKLGLSDRGLRTEDCVQRILEFVTDASSSTPAVGGADARARDVKQPERSIFVVHGHDTAMRIDVSRTLEKQGIKPIVLAHEPNKGLTIIEKLENQIGRCTHALVLLSPDDVGNKAGHDGARKARARQNVILELGFVIGKLGRRNVIILHRGDVELPSDMYGLVYIPYKLEDHGVTVELLREIRSMGYDVDTNLVL